MPRCLQHVVDESTEAPRRSASIFYSTLFSCIYKLPVRVCNPWCFCSWSPRGRRAGAELGQNLPNASWSIVAATDRDVCTICKYWGRPRRSQFPEIRRSRTGTVLFCHEKQQPEWGRLYHNDASCRFKRLESHSNPCWWHSSEERFHQMNIQTIQKPCDWYEPTYIWWIFVANVSKYTTHGCFFGNICAFASGILV